MDFWDNISDKIEDVITDTKKGAKKLTGIAKLKYDISQKHCKIRDLFKQIGELTYEQYKSEVDNTDAIQAILCEIKVTEDEAEALSQEITRLKGKNYCPKCCIPVDGEFDFCPKCGSKLERAEDGENEEDEKQTDE